MHSTYFNSEPWIHPAYQRDGRMDKTIGLNAGRSWFRIPGRRNCSLRTTVVDAVVNHQLDFFFSSGRVAGGSASSHHQVPPQRQCACDDWGFCIHPGLCSVRLRRAVKGVPRLARLVPSQRQWAGFGTGLCLHPGLYTDFSCGQESTSSD